MHPDLHNSATIGEVARRCPWHEGCATVQRASHSHRVANDMIRASSSSSVAASCASCGGGASAHDPRLPQALSIAMQHSTKSPSSAPSRLWPQVGQPDSPLFSPKHRGAQQRSFVHRWPLHPSPDRPAPFGDRVACIAHEAIYDACSSSCSSQKVSVDDALDSQAPATRSAQSWQGLVPEMSASSVESGPSQPGYAVSTVARAAAISAMHNSTDPSSSSSSVQEALQDAHQAPASDQPLVVVHISTDEASSSDSEGAGVGSLNVGGAHDTQPFQAHCNVNTQTSGIWNSGTAVDHELPQSEAASRSNSIRASHIQVDESQPPHTELVNSSEVQPAPSIGIERPDVAGSKAVSQHQQSEAPAAAAPSPGPPDGAEGTTTFRMAFRSTRAVLPTLSLSPVAACQAATRLQPVAAAHELQSSGTQTRCDNMAEHSAPNTSNAASGRQLAEQKRVCLQLAEEAVQEVVRRNAQADQRAWCSNVRDQAAVSLPLGPAICSSLQAPATFSSANSGASLNEMGGAGSCSMAPALPSNVLTVGGNAVMAAEAATATQRMQHALEEQSLQNLCSEIAEQVSFEQAARRQQDNGTVSAVLLEVQDREAAWHTLEVANAVDAAALGQSLQDSSRGSGTMGNALTCMVNAAFTVDFTGVHFVEALFLPACKEA